MTHSESIKTIAAALALFQIKAEKIIKKADNPFFKSKYADLPSILDEINIPLKEAGLVITQWPDGDGLTTILLHPDSGEYMMSTAQMHPVKSDPQAMGSALTYQRRYSITSILCLNIDKDDDGNAASEPQISTNIGGKTVPANNDSAGNPTNWLNQFMADKTTETVEWQKSKAFMQKSTNKESGLTALRKHYKISKEAATILSQY